LPGNRWTLRQKSNIVLAMIVNEGDLLTYLLAGLAMLGTLVLAWRGYRHESREDRERKKAVKRKSTVKR
jgi:hypothetical protein